MLMCLHFHLKYLLIFDLLPIRVDWEDQSLPLGMGISLQKSSYLLGLALSQCTCSISILVAYTVKLEGDREKIRTLLFSFKINYKLLILTQVMRAS